MFTNITVIRENVSKSVDRVVSAINKRVVTFNLSNSSDDDGYHENRGKWSSSWDFQAACLCYAFGMKRFTLVPQFIFMHWGLGVFFLVSYILDLIIFTLPIFFIQTFLGQFSGSGYISAYRFAPIAKGLGYVILIFNVISVGYGSINAAVPLVYIFGSFTLPWSTCNNAWNTIECKDDPPKIIKFDPPIRGGSFLDDGQTWASTEFFYKAIALKDSEGWQVSWRIIVCTILVWLGICAIISKGLRLISKLFRYSTFLMIVIVLIIFIRILCLPGTIKTIIKFILPTKTINIFEIFMTWVYSSVPNTLTFGPGWGCILTVSSFNSFNKNLRKLSIIICICHMIIVIVTGLIVFLIRQYLQEYHNFILANQRGVNQLDYIYIGFPYLFSKLELSQLWSLIFYLMIFLSEFSSCVLQIFSILTSIFDEHQRARDNRDKIVISLLASLFVASIFFASNRGFVMFSVRYSIEGIIQMLICLLELGVIVWIFGRMQFQRDYKFMLQHDFQTWAFYVLRFITPFCVLLVMMFYIIIACINVFDNKQIPNPSSLLIMKLIPFFVFIPGYIGLKLFEVKENRKTQTIIKELCQPKDWCPTDKANMRLYKEMFNGYDIDNGEKSSSLILNNYHDHQYYQQEQQQQQQQQQQNNINAIQMNGNISQLRKMSEVEICIEFDI